MHQRSNDALFRVRFILLCRVLWLESYVQRFHNLLLWEKTHFMILNFAWMVALVALTLMISWVLCCRGCHHHSLALWLQVVDSSLG